MILFYLLFAFLIVIAIKIAAGWWRVARYGLDDSDPRGQRRMLSQIVDLALGAAITIVAFWVVSVGHKRGLTRSSMYAAVFFGALSVAVVTRFPVSRLRRFSDYELKTAFFSKIVESLVIAIVFAVVLYPIYRWIWIK